MKLKSSGIINGVIQDRYGKRGEKRNSAGMVTYSLPFKILDPPYGTVSYAVFLEDKDSVPVCGFCWIHWLCANLTKVELLPNESIDAKDFIQGATSWSGKYDRADRLATSIYGGMAPPNAPHTYELHVFALDCLLDLKPGFYWNELYWAMQGHILTQATIQGVYDN